MRPLVIWMSHTVDYFVSCRSSCATWVKRFFASAMSSCSPGAQMLSPTGSSRFRVATIRLVCIEYRSPFLFIFFLSWSETIPCGKGKHHNTRNAHKNWLSFMLCSSLCRPWFTPHPTNLHICQYLWHLTLGVSDEEGHVVDLILDHKVLLFSLEVLEMKTLISHHSIVTLLWAEHTAWAECLALYLSHLHFSTVLMSVAVEYVTDMKRIHTSAFFFFL